MEIHPIHLIVLVNDKKSKCKFNNSFLLSSYYCRSRGIKEIFNRGGGALEKVVLSQGKHSVRTAEHLLHLIPKLVLVKYLKLKAEKDFNP